MNPVRNGVKMQIIAKSNIDFGTNDQPKMSQLVPFLTG